MPGSMEEKVCNFQSGSQGSPTEHVAFKQRLERGTGTSQEGCSRQRKERSTGPERVAPGTEAGGLEWREMGTVGDTNQRRKRCVRRGQWQVTRDSRAF